MFGTAKMDITVITARKEKETVCLTNISLSPAFQTVSSLVFFVVIVVLLSILYRNDLQCCKLCSHRGPRADMVRKTTHKEEKLPFVLF